MKAMKVRDLVTITPAGKVSLRLDSQLVHMLTECLDEYISTLNAKPMRLYNVGQAMNKLLAVSVLEMFRQHFHGSLVLVKRSYTIRMSEAITLWLLSQSHPAIFRRNPQLTNLFMKLHQKL